MIPKILLLADPTVVCAYHVALCSQSIGVAVLVERCVDAECCIPATGLELANSIQKFRTKR